MRPVTILFALAALAAAGEAQQSGDANRNYVVNEQGSLQSSPSPVTVPNCSICTEWRNDYDTADAGAPVAWVGSSQATIGWFTTATNSVDIGPSSLAVLLDGADPSNPLALYLRTDAAGFFSVDLNVPPGVLGNTVYVAMLHFAASSPDGFWISQTHEVSFDGQNALSPSQYSACGGTVLNLGDDSALLVPMGMTFELYGGTYTQVWVCSNGFLTFGASDTDFSESVFDLANGPRRVAAWWDDLDPSWYGSVRYQATSSASQQTFRVCWANVPEYIAGGLNNFSVTLVRPLITIGGIDDYLIHFDYPFFNSGDGLVGVSPGFSVFFGPAATMEIDLSAGPHVLPSGSTAYYELFERTTHPIDVYGHRVTFDLDPNGFPAVQS